MPGVRVGTGAVARQPTSLPRSATHDALRLGVAVERPPRPSAFVSGEVPRALNDSNRDEACGRVGVKSRAHDVASINHLEAPVQQMSAA